MGLTGVGVADASSCGTVTVVDRADWHRQASRQSGQS